MRCPVTSGKVSVPGTRVAGQHVGRCKLPANAALVAHGFGARIVSTVVAGRAVVAIQCRGMQSRHLCATHVCVYVCVLCVFVWLCVAVCMVLSGDALVHTSRPARTSVDLGVESAGDQLA